MLFVKLVDLYGRYGFKIRSSMSPFLLTKLSLNSAEDGTFTYAFREGTNIGNLGGGINMSEVGLIEDIGQVYTPKRIFAIGCSFGWSTLALAMAMPKAKIVAIDIGMGNGKEGLALTNQIAQENGFDVTGVLGSSPGDLAATVAAHFAEPIDMVFVDADHTNEAQNADFAGIRPHCAPDALYMFHDVMVCQMLPSFKSIAAAMPTHKPRVLSRTASGIGILAPLDGSPALHGVLDAYCDPYGAIPI
jgi:predicted O-methyltransferase YrrM